VTGRSGAEDAAIDLARTTEHAVAYARRVASTARARNERLRAENAELIKQFGRRQLAGSATERAPGAVRDAAKRFRSANGLPVPQSPSVAELVPPRRYQSRNPPRSGDDDEDFSQARIMIRGD
jgi:hypothetical protein